MATRHFPQAFLHADAGLLSRYCAQEARTVHIASSYPHKNFSREAGSYSIKREGLFREIYKDIEYTSPFTHDQNAFVLEILNNSSEEELAQFTAKAKAANIFQHREQHGPFNVVEELLALSSFDENTLERLGKKVIKLGRNSSYESETESDKLAKKEKKLLQYIKPKIDSYQYQSDDINSFVGIKLSLQNLSYAHMDKNTQEIKSWKHISCFANINSKTEFEHPKIFQKAFHIANQIPLADMYVLEEQPLITPNKTDPYMKAKGNNQNLHCSRQ